jgi:hypothetical protein
MAIPGYHGPTEGRRYDPGLASDIEHFGSRSKDDPRNGWVAHELTERVRIEYDSVFGFVEASRFAFDGVEIDMHVYVWSLSSHKGRFGSVEEAAGQVFEGVGSPLTGCPRIIGGRWRHQSVDRGQECFPGQSGQFELPGDHPIGATAQIEMASPKLLFDVESHSGDVYVVSPVVENLLGLLHRVADDLEQDVLGVR